MGILGLKHRLNSQDEQKRGPLGRLQTNMAHLIEERIELPTADLLVTTVQAIMTLAIALPAAPATADHLANLQLPLDPSGEWQLEEAEEVSLPTTMGATW